MTAAIDLANSECLITKTSIGHDVVYDVCHHTQVTVPWLAGDWIAAGLVVCLCIIGLMFIGFLVVMIKEL